MGNFLLRNVSRRRRRPKKVEFCPSLIPGSAEIEVKCTEFESEARVGRPGRPGRRSAALEILKNEHILTIETCASSGYSSFRNTFKSGTKRLKGVVISYGEVIERGDCAYRHISKISSHLS